MYCGEVTWYNQPSGYVIVIDGHAYYVSQSSQ